MDPQMDPQMDTDFVFTDGSTDRHRFVFTDLPRWIFAFSTFSVFLCLSNGVNTDYLVFSNQQRAVFYNPLVTGWF